MSVTVCTNSLWSSSSNSCSNYFYFSLYFSSIYLSSNTGSGYSTFFYFIYSIFYLCSLSNCSFWRLASKSCFYLISSIIYYVLVSYLNWLFSTLTGGGAPGESGKSITSIASFSYFEIFIAALASESFFLSI